MKKLLMLFMSACLLSCTPQVSKNDLEKALKDNPQIIFDILSENPEKFIDTLKMAAQIAQQKERKDREDDEKKQLEEAYTNPIQPEIRKNEIIRGSMEAPLTLVEYSDFECPYCKNGYETVQSLLKKYNGKIRFIYKHLPLSFHPNAMNAAKYFEAIALQSAEKAWKFHDEVFENQRKLVKNGEQFLKSVATDLKLNMKKLETDLASPAVEEKIKADIEEATKHGFQGTPGFLINGVPVRGAHPESSFDEIIAELQKRGKITI